MRYPPGSNSTTGHLYMKQSGPKVTEYFERILAEVYCLPLVDHDEKEVLPII